MKPPGGCDLDAEIAKYGGRVSLGMFPLEAADTGAPATVPPPFDLDAEIAKYGGHTSEQPSAQARTADPLAVMRQSDPSCCAQVEAFAKVLGASVDMVVPRGAPDPRMAGGMSWPRWERRRLDQIFCAGRITMAEARAQEEERKAERAAWAEKWRKVQRGWAKWVRWRRQSPQMADAYRQQYQDADSGDEKWLLEFGSVRQPTKSQGQKIETEEQTYEKETESIAASGTSVIGPGRRVKYIWPAA
jgi:hypothetical protein